jgi:hypothetical protein
MLTQSDSDRTGNFSGRLKFEEILQFPMRKLTTELALASMLLASAVIG